ncbi:MAG: hypothetical protein GXP22_00805 [Gammaproteobacteria bacterium]|nr:hypothetical protein [Gammaproteobacteria bacterium]
MQINTTRRLVDVVILFIAGNYLYNFMGDLSSSIIGFFASLAYIFFYRLARKALGSPPFSYYFFMWVPTVVFVFAPVGYDFYQADSAGLISWAVGGLPWFQLILPIVLLYIVREELKK